MGSTIDCLFVLGLNNVPLTYTAVCGDHSGSHSTVLVLNSWQNAFAKFCHSFLTVIPILILYYGENTCLGIPWVPHITYFSSC